MGKKLLLEVKKRVVVCLFIWVFLFLSPLAFQLNDEGDFLYFFVFMFCFCFCFAMSWFRLQAFAIFGAVLFLAFGKVQACFVAQTTVLDMTYCLDAEK